MAPRNPSQCGRKQRLRPLDWMARPPFSAESVWPLHADKQNSAGLLSSLGCALSTPNIAVLKLPAYAWSQRASAVRGSV
ncbi:hypothetical protein T08_12638 [Trichinella sp. T8]|nr:hypothetical protein T08_12638 [Trichinella sp. T8]